MANRAVYRAERAVAGALFLAMAVVMFASVTHRVFSRDEGRISTLLLWITQRLGARPEPALFHGPISIAFNVTLALILVYAALRTMSRQPAMSRRRAVALALPITALLGLAVKTILIAWPNGIVWGPVVSLACMLWVGFLGASIATYEKRHLSLEIADKIWPLWAAPSIRGLSLALTACFCLFLLALSIVSLTDHHAGWMINRLAGNLLPTAIPKWIVFLIFPYTFCVMLLRFVGAAVEAVAAKS